MDSWPTWLLMGDQQRNGEEHMGRDTNHRSQEGQSQRSFIDGNALRRLTYEPSKTWNRSINMGSEAMIMDEGH